MWKFADYCLGPISLDDHNWTVNPAVGLRVFSSGGFDPGFEREFMEVNVEELMVRKVWELRRVFENRRDESSSWVAVQTSLEPGKRRQTLF
jgi:hypothetical protein